MLKYDIIRRNRGSIADHFEELTTLLTEKFREKDRDYTTTFYDVGLVSPEVSASIDPTDVESLSDILLWHPLDEEKREGIITHYILDAKTAIKFVKKFENEIGAVHFDLITPYPPFEIGRFITRYKGDRVGTLELDIFSDFDVMPNFDQTMDRILINFLRRRYSCECTKELCSSCEQETVVRESYSF